MMFLESVILESHKRGGLWVFLIMRAECLCFKVAPPLRGLEMIEFYHNGVCRNQDFFFLLLFKNRII